MTYAITGSSGFIGKAMQHYLKAKGHEVLPVKRVLLRGITELSDWFDINNIDEIVHLAAYGNHYNQTDHKEIFRVNVLYSYNLFAASNGRNVYNFSTSSVTLPHKTQYSISKRTGEDLALLFPNVINIRPYSVYGPGEALHRFIPTVIHCLMTGNSMRVDESACHDWIYITDAIDAMFNGHTDLGTGQSYSNLQIVQLLESISGKRLNYEPVGRLRVYDTSDWVCNNPVPNIGIVEGLKLTWHQYDRS